MKDLTLIPDKIFREIKEIIREESGIIINDDRMIDFEIVLRARLANNSTTPEEYVNLLRNSDNEIIIIASFFTIQESSFYRNKYHFDRLREIILPEIKIEKQMQNNRKILILSAGCATGEEPYTIAMIINDLFFDSSEWDIEIIATDINKNAIDFASFGVYSGYKLRNIDDYYKNKYFDIIKENKNVSYRIKDSIRKYISFRQCNLIKEPFMLENLRDVDIIFCENVIIYFRRESVQRLINNFYDILNDNGYLFLGYSETLNMVKHPFHLTWWKESFAYQKKALELTDNSNEESFVDIIKKSAIVENENVNINIPYKDYMMLAIQNYKKGHSKNVAMILEELEKNKKELKEDFYTIKAEYLLDNGDFMNAANLCRNAITIDPYCIDAHMILGDIYIRISMYDKAEFEIKTVLYFNDSYALAYYFLAIYYQKTGDQLNYVSSIKRAVELSKKKAGIFENYIYPVSDKKRESIRQNIMAEKIELMETI